MKPHQHVTEYIAFKQALGGRFQTEARILTLYSTVLRIGEALSHQTAAQESESYEFHEKPKSLRHVQQKMRQLMGNIRQIFDYLCMTENSCACSSGGWNKFTVKTC